MKNDAVKIFEDYCATHNLRVTPPRLSAFKIVQASDKPITAYAVLEEMARRDGNNPKPPTAYRALDFLEEHGFLHRIESLNAYVSCDVNHKHNGSQFMICDSCNAVEEVHLCSLPARLQEKVQQEGFRLNHWNVEIHGFCAKCA